MRLLATANDPMLTLLRVVAGTVVAAHGAQKLLGWFGGHGPIETMNAFEQWFGLPKFVTALVIASDSFGAIALIVGLFTRFAALGIAAVMIGAIALVHGRSGFYMNWYSQPRGEGFEFHLLMLAIMLVLIVRGGGAWSVDRAWAERSTARGPSR